MDFTPLLSQGLQLMAVGMTVVILFLVLLIGVLKLVSAIVGHYEDDVAPSSDEPLDGVVSSSSVDEEIVAVISSAVHRYRAQLNK